MELNGSYGGSMMGTAAGYPPAGQYQQQHHQPPIGGPGNERLVQSTPGSPQDRRPNSIEVIGSAESLVGRVSDMDNCILCVRPMNN